MAAPYMWPLVCGSTRPSTPSWKLALCPVDAIWMTRSGSSCAARNAPMVTSQTAAHSGRPRRNPTTETPAATSAQTTRQTAMIVGMLLSTFRTRLIGRRGGADRGLLPQDGADEQPDDPGRGQAKNCVLRQVVGGREAPGSDQPPQYEPDQPRQPHQVADRPGDSRRDDDRCGDQQ